MGGRNTSTLRPLARAPPVKKDLDNEVGTDHWHGMRDWRSWGHPTKKTINDAKDLDEKGCSPGILKRVHFS